MNRNQYYKKKQMISDTNISVVLQRVKQISEKITSLNRADDSSYLIALVGELNGHIEKLYILARISHQDCISLAKICRLHICDKLGYIPN